MKLPRRRFLHLAAGAATLPGVSRIARAQAYPSRPVRIIVGFAPAGGTDIVARRLSRGLRHAHGMALARPRTRPPKSSTSSTRRLTLHSPIPRC